MIDRLKSAAVSILAVALGGCASQNQPRDESYEVAFQVTTDDGAPLPAVELAAGKHPLGKTDSAGQLKFRLRGKEGQVIAVDVRCPEQYTSPEPVSLRLATTRKVGQGDPRPIVADALCTGKRRDVVLVVHAAGAAELPVLVDGKLASMTDAQGNAHVLVPVDRDVRSLSASLDTSSRSELKPANPSRVFELEGPDTVVIFTQHFTKVRPRRVPTRSVGASPKRHVPFRIE